MKTATRKVGSNERKFYSDGCAFICGFVGTHIKGELAVIIPLRRGCWNQAVKFMYGELVCNERIDGPDETK